jgi:D-alanyl-D-alanine carboxypeptidase (penicillin-binding protein 5/6)
MRTPTTLVAAALATLVTLAPAASAETPETVGGSRLASRGLVVAPGAPALPRTAAAGWLVADMDTGEVLAAKDPHGRYAPASTMKILTAHTLIDRLDPATLVKPTWDDVNVEGSRVGIVQQMRYTVKDLLTAMLVVSGNDAANALATANGGLAPTLAQMNAEAARLQAFDTRAMNPSGLDHPKQLSSPYDLALIGREAMTSPAFRSYVATKRYYLPAPGKKTIYLATHNKLVWNYEGAIGIKNGYTVKSRATFVGAATRGGRTLIVTLMKTEPRYWPEAAALLDWGFKASARGVQPVGQLVDPVPDPAPSASPQATAPLAARTADAGSGLPVLPSLFVGAGVAVLGTGLLRTRRVRRRRSRYRSRLKLNLPL